MQGMKDLLASERGVFAILILIAATVLAALKIIDKSDWMTLIQWVGVSLIASKTITTAIETHTMGGSIPSTTAAGSSTEPKS